MEVYGYLNRANDKPGAGRAIAGMLIGMVLAVLSPLVMMTELLSLVVVLMLPSIALVALNRWAGRGAAFFSAMLQLMFSARFLGSAFMWMSFFLTLLPVALLIRNENKLFFTQMKISIAAFGAGVLLSVLSAYASYGGNMVERVLLELPKLVRTLPAESMEVIMESYSALIGNAMSVEEFYHVFDQMIHALIPVYQANLPGLIFAGALVSAVLCVGLNGLMRSKQGIAAGDSYLPMREWALPGSATGGLLLILLISFIMSAAGMQQGDAVLYAVYDIAAAAFCIQALCSMARHLHVSPLKHGVRVVIVSVLAVLCVSGASLYVSIYGVASAVFGSRGLLREHTENKQNNNHFDGNE